MYNFMQFVRPLLPIAVVVLLFVIAVPAEANNGTASNNGASTTTVQQTTPPATPQDSKQTKVVQKKPVQRSVLDADVLERPLSFFQNYFSPEEEDTDDTMFSHSTTVLIAVKALIASVLSTII